MLQKPQIIALWNAQAHLAISYQSFHYSILKIEHHSKTYFMCSFLAQDER